MDRRPRAVEALVIDRAAWAGRRVLVTGHTGFKGGWLALLLHELGAVVTGLALPPPTLPSLFEEARIADLLDHRIGDIRDEALVRALVAEVRPEIVFHLAAQPLVRASYAAPVETYATNVMGTVHLLEAARQAGGVRAFVCVTTDKCYENREWVWPYRESDPIGGHDPYSSSKGAAELVVAAYRASYFAAPGAMALASARAGNVIGGGDWAEDRLLPDLVRALTAGTRPVIRASRSVRPWQHVLDALGGYLMLGERLLAGERGFAQAWNFGPAENDARPVGWIVGRMLEAWGLPADAWDRAGDEGPHEAALLRLDCAKARTELGWRPTLGLDSALTWISDWHRSHRRGADAREISLEQVRAFLAAERAPAAAA